MSSFKNAPISSTWVTKEIDRRFAQRSGYTFCVLKWYCRGQSSLGCKIHGDRLNPTLRQFTNLRFSASVWWINHGGIRLIKFIWQKWTAVQIACFMCQFFNPSVLRQAASIACIIVFLPSTAWTSFVSARGR